MPIVSNIAQIARVANISSIVLQINFANSMIAAKLRRGPIGGLQFEKIRFQRTSLPLRPLSQHQRRIQRFPTQRHLQQSLNPRRFQQYRSLHSTQRLHRQQAILRKCQLLGIHPDGTLKLNLKFPPVENLSAFLSAAIVVAMMKIIVGICVKKMTSVNIISNRLGDDANYFEVAICDVRNKFLTAGRLGVRNYYLDPWMTEGKLLHQTY